MSLATPIPLERLCHLAQVSRAGYYRWHGAPSAADPDLDLRDEIQRIALESPSYGWPRITAELKRRGWEVNHKRVYRIMREDNLLCLRRRKYVVTTNSHHNRPVYPNLAGTMVVRDSTLSGNNAITIGGAIDNRDTLFIINSTLSGNSTSNRSAGTKPLSRCKVRRPPLLKSRNFDFTTRSHWPNRARSIRLFLI